MAATTKRLYLIRHGQAEHNVHEEYDKHPDALLTAKGRQQCQELHELTKDTIQQKGDLVVSSVMKRTMETMLLGVPDLVKRLEREGKPPIILDILQEVGPAACDVPTYPLDELKKSEGGIFAEFDYSHISPEYASKKGIFDPQAAIERGRTVRKWLKAREERHIVVVTHGDILRCMVDGVSRYLSDHPEIAENFRHWKNGEVKVFTFREDDDDEATLVEVKEGVEPKNATTAPTAGERV